MFSYMFCKTWNPMVHVRAMEPVGHIQRGAAGSGPTPFQRTLQVPHPRTRYCTPVPEFIRIYTAALTMPPSNLWLTPALLKSAPYACCLCSCNWRRFIVSA